MFNLTDRETEAAIKENAAYQLFCGCGTVVRWHAPDHTKIETFRSRLSPETQQRLANLMCTNAVDIGIATANDLDIDSTVQEANMTYPTDAKMLRKLGTIASRVANGLKGVASTAVEQAVDLTVDLKEIASHARDCFFLPKKAGREKKSEVLKKLWSSVSDAVIRVLTSCKLLADDSYEKLSWNSKRAMEQLMAHSESYLYQ